MSDDWRHWPVDDWAAVRGLLDHALSLPSDQRAHWLDTLQGDQAVHRDRLRALLGQADAHAGFETLPKVETSSFAAATTDQLTDAAEQAGDMVGPYRLLSRLGEGGMASVWLAERTDQLQGRQVALKLPHGAWRRAGLAQRLAREREILATLEHPHIARLYDAGVTPAGQPFLALEWVDGLPLDRWCAEHSPPLRERLALFLQVCDAVAHAHAHLVVHRDLKPGNILVDQAGQVRLLDFGIAKLLEGDHVAETALTREVGRAFTPEYASPEQIAGRPLGTAADVYALGVVLFELLVGSRPYSLGTGTLARLEQAVLAVEPPRPSSRVQDAGRRRALQGDIDTIVLKALKKAPEERYDSVRALADDLRRHLANQPVLARPDRTGYRLRKWMLRNRLVAGAGSIVMLAVLGGAGLALWQARVAIAERDRAQQVRGFIESIFRDADPELGDQSPPTVAALLQRARQRVDRELASTPALQVEMLTLLGNSLSNMNEGAAAAQALDDAVQRGQKALGADDGAVLKARVVRLGVYRFQGRTDLAKAEIDQLLPMLRERPPLIEDLVITLRERAHLAMDEHRHADMQAPAAEALRLARTHLGEDHRLTADCAMVMALVYGHLKQVVEAKSGAQEALRLALRVHAGQPNHPDVGNARVTLGRALGDVGEFVPAVEQIKVAVEDARARLGPESLNVGFYLVNLGKLQAAAGQVDRAADSAAESVSVIRKAAEPGTDLAAAASMNWGAALLAARRPARAAQVLQDAFSELARLKRDEPNPFTQMARAHLAVALAQQGDSEEARRQINVALAQPATPRVLRLQAQVERLAGRPEAAEPLVRQALQAAQGPAGAPERLLGTLELGQVLVAAGRAEQALPVLQQAAGLLDSHQVAGGTPDRADLWLARGRAHLALGQADQAQPWLQQADAFWRGFDGADPRFGAEAAQWLARAQPAKASPQR